MPSKFVQRYEDIVLCILSCLVIKNNILYKKLVCQTPTAHFTLTISAGGGGGGSWGGVEVGGVGHQAHGGKYIQ
jgi:hypothetical protein